MEQDEFCRLKTCVPEWGLYIFVVPFGPPLSSATWQHSQVGGVVWIVYPSVGLFQFCDGLVASLLNFIRRLSDGLYEL